MAKVTPGNRLYFYQLLSTEIGFGKQVRITQVEEVLSEADVLLDDVDCATIDELMAQLSDFVKLTVFKGGRRFVTIVKNEDIEADLQRAEDLAASKKAAASAGKAWKHGRASKVPSPAKPRHKRKSKPESAAPTTDAAAPDGAAATADAATTETVAAVTQEVRDEGTPDSGIPREDVASEVTPSEDVPVEGAPSVPGEDVPEADPEVAPDEADSGKDAPGEDTPAEPAPDENAPDGTEASSAVPDADAPEGDAPGEQTSDGIEPDEGKQGEDAPQDTPSTKPIEDSAPADSQTPAPQEQDPTADAQDPEPSISLTITYRPPANEDDSEPTAAGEAEMDDTTETRGTIRMQDAGPSFPKHAIRWPERISDEVFCSDQLLFGLYQALPGSIGILDALDEGWRLAQEAGTLEGTRTMVTFPLSRRIEGNPPIEVTIRRTPRIPSGKHWSLTNVDTGLD